MKRMTEVEIEKRINEATVATKRALEALSCSREMLLLGKGSTIDVVVREALLELAASEDDISAHFRRFEPRDGRRPVKSEEADEHWSKCCRRRDEAIDRLLKIGQGLKAPTEAAAE